MTPFVDFKVTIIFSIKYLENGTKWSNGRLIGSHI